MTLGFIGVGTMGGPLARNLIRAGKTVLVYNRTPHKIDAVLAAGTTGRRAAAFADFAVCDVVFTCLALPEHVTQAMLGPDGVYAFLRPGSVHVELSTIDPATAHALADAAGQRGVAYVQCTLGKTPAHAERAEEPLFIGGDPQAVERVSPLFPLIGVPNFVGTIDAACAVKLISNLIGMANLAVLAEGLRLGEAAGLSPADLLPLLADTGARSFQMDVRGPWMAASDYAPRFALNLALKDVRLGCEMARSWGLSPQLMEAALAIFRRAAAGGHGVEDCAAVYEEVCLRRQGATAP